MTLDEALARIAALEREVARVHDRALDRLVIEAIDDTPRFVLRLPGGWTVPIASVRELLRAVAHFYRGHTPLRAGCPLCHDIRLNPLGPLTQPRHSGIHADSYEEGVAPLSPDQLQWVLDHNTQIRAGHRVQIADAVAAWRADQARVQALEREVARLTGGGR